MKVRRDAACVSVETPCRGRVPHWVPALVAPLVERYSRRRNMQYALECVLDSLARGEAPYASHVFFDRRGLLDDANPLHREVGMLCGALWTRRADKFVFYLDLGWSRGMQLAHRDASLRGHEIELRYLRRDRVSEAKNLLRMLGWI